jgi:hypothetical protein
MSANALGRLSRVGLRQIFETEAASFTPWLAQDANLSLLGEAIGISLELEAQEKDVGPFRADLLCKDTATDYWVLIENQIERTDHTHLGQLITYAAGLQAVTVVWIAERFTDEHRAALDWLNEKTDEGINFFGLEIELWRIADSPIAPKFNIVSQPNDWTRTVQDAARATGEMSEHRQMQLRFWHAFREYMESSQSSVRCQTPGPRHWMDHAIGRSGVYLSSVVSPELRVGLVLNSDYSKHHFAELEAKKEQIESLLGCHLIWHNPPGRKMLTLYVKRDADFMDQSDWPQQHLWLKENLEKFKRVFSPYVRELGSNSATRAAVATD